MKGALECFWVALRLGCISFGGPVAHLGYFQREYVEKRSWLSEESFVELLALCQLLPGPASSQLGAAIGAERAGLAGGFAAWIGFTLPSAVFLGLAGLGIGTLQGEWLAGVVSGLIVITVSVVAVATLQLGKKLCAGWLHAGIALIALALLFVIPHPLMQVVVILLGGAVGARLINKEPTVVAKGDRSMWLTTVSLVVFFGLLAASYFGFLGDLYGAIYHAGALVFGGGHVVLPLLEETVVATDVVDQGTFMAGYGLAQAVPGPLFTIGSFVGAVGGGWMGACVGSVLIFLPGMLLLAAALPQRQWLSRQKWAGGAVAGAGAAVVGLLAAALLQLVLSEALTQIWQWLAVMVSIIFLLKKWLPIWLLVIVLAGLGIIFSR